MVRFLYDFIPVLLFFIAFKWYGIYTATIVGIVATALQVVVTFLWQKKLDRQQCVTFVVFLIFGGMTLYFHNPIFVKWKPTIIFWLMGIAFLGSHFIGEKTFVQRMMENGLKGSQLNKNAWRRLNSIWIIFFAVLGGMNLFVAYHFSTNAWVNFKLYGISGLLLLFCFMQAIWLARYLDTATSEK